MSAGEITIPQFFQNKTVFITGATGFIGKLLIEKLLWSTPDVKKIYILVREKKGKSPEERLKNMFSLDIFNRVREKYPENLKKVVPVIGDVAELGLGLSLEDKEKLINEVNIVYHSAASVRFDDSLKYSIILNTRGTRETILLAKQCKNLECYVHISTTYCHTDRSVVGEEFYPPLADWRSVIEVAEKTDSQVLETLTQKLIYPLPNTYTFTKRLGEQVVKDLCEGHVPTVLVRPSIVIGTCDDPFPGWVENLNGPIGIWVASGKGVLKTVYGDPDIAQDMVPIDFVVKGLIVVAWLKCLEQGKRESLEPTVYNFSNNRLNNKTLGEMTDIAEKHFCMNPLNDTLWIPHIDITPGYIMHCVRFLFYQLLPAMVIDGLLTIIGKKPMLFKIQRKIYIANMALTYYITHEWEFQNQKIFREAEKILPSDLEHFSILHMLTEDIDKYSKNVVLGIRKYLLKEDEASLEGARRHLKRMQVVSVVSKIAAYGIFIYLLFFKWNVLGRLWDAVYNYFENI